MTASLQQLQKITYSLIITIIVFWLLEVGSFIVVPLVWSMFFSLSLYPISNWLEEKKLPRSISIILTLLLVTGLAVLILYFLVVQVMNMILEIPEIKVAFQEKMSGFFLFLEETFGIQNRTLPGIDEILNSVNINNTLIETGKSLTLAAVIPLFIFLMLYYKDFFLEFLFKVAQGKNQSILNWIDESGQIIQSYLVGMTIVTGIVSVLAGFLFYVLGIKYFVLFAVFIAVMNLIPYIGVVISSLVVVFYVLLTTDSFVYPLITLLSLWVLQLVENNLITPLVVGTKVKINTMVVVLAIIIGGSLWGVSGMILFIPIVGVLKITLDRIPSLAPYGYLLGDKFPVNEKGENYWKILQKRMKKKKEA